MDDYLADLAREITSMILPTVDVYNCNISRVPRGLRTVVVPVIYETELIFRAEPAMSVKLKKIDVEMKLYQDEFGRQIKLGYCEKTNTIYYS